MKIISYGEIIWDVYPDRKALGGAPLNFALHASAVGAETAIVSAVGYDGLGDEALGIIGSRGVDTQYVGRSERPTGRCNVTLDEKKIPSYELMRDTAYDSIALSESDIKKISAEGYDAICFGTLIQRSPISRDTLRDLVARSGIRTIFCDVNLRSGNYDAESASFCLENSTLLKVSLEEAPALNSLRLYKTPDDTSPLSIARVLFDSYPCLMNVALTDGERGAYSMSRGGKLIFCPAPKVKVVSTVGAGDSFGAAWLVSLFSGDGESVALEKAVRYSADVISGKL